MARAWQQIPFKFVMLVKKNITLYLALLTTWLCIYYLGWEIERHQFGQLILAVGIGSIALFWGLNQYKGNFSLSKTLLLVGVFRVGLFSVFPSLSDDIYRFLWDGYWTAHGINPYLHTPAEMLQTTSSNYLHTLFLNLNSPNYYAIYPAFAQYLYAFCHTIGGESLQGQLKTLRVLTLIAELSTAWLLVSTLKRTSVKPKWALLFLLSPFYVLEGFVNLHIESIVLCWLALALWYIVKRRYLGSALFMGLAIVTKFHVLYFFPFISLYTKKKNLFVYGLITLAFAALLFAPFAQREGFVNLFESIRLFSQSFEYNASVYYLVRALNSAWLGYNPIAIVGPSLMAIAAILSSYFFALAWKGGRAEVLKWSILGYLGYLLFATTVHPWYLLLPAFLGVYVGYLFPLVWGTLAMLSYYGYGSDPVMESAYILTLEYLLAIGFMMWELTKPKGFLMRGKISF